MKRMKMWHALALAALVLGGCGSDNDVSAPRLYGLYGDYDSDQVYKIDTRAMKLDATMHTSPAQGPYGVECDTQSEAFALTRRSESIAVVNFRKDEVVAVIDLPFKPRSTATSHKAGLVLVSGKSEPMAVTIGIRDHEVHETFGQPTDQNVDTARYFGGGNNTGHPFWLADGRRFLLLDRVHLKIFLYDRDRPDAPLAELDTNTTAHHVVTLPEEHDAEGNGDYYVVLEGPKDANDSSVGPAGIMKFRIDADNGMREVKTFYASHDAGGAHHTRFYAGKYLYLPTFNEVGYVVDKDTMEATDTFPCGKGGGHIHFSDSEKIAIVTNHKDTYVTVLDVSDPAHPVEKEKITVAKPLTPEQLAEGLNAQSHTATFDRSGRFYYSVANCDHKFYEIDTDFGWISRTCYLPGTYVPMGDFIYY
ncbi:hypothetical protein [Hydrogenimonas sp.]